MTTMQHKYEQEWQQNAIDNAMNELRIMREYIDSIEKAQRERKDWTRGLIGYTHEKVEAIKRAADRVERYANTVNDVPASIWDEEDAQ